MSGDRGDDYMQSMQEPSDQDRLKARLRLLQSDLKDSTNPEVLARYPHLGAASLREEIKTRIDEVRRQLGEIPPLPLDKVVEAVRADLLRRSQLGIQKYGMTLERTDLSLKQWLQHAYEETLDQANYLKRAIIEIEKHEQE